MLGMFNYPGDIFMNRRHVLHAIGLAAALATGTVQAQSNELKVAIDPTYEPFTYKTPDGKPTGFDVDIAEAICAKLNRKCVYVEQVWDGMIPGLMARKYDVIISSMSITDERKKTIDFSDKYYNTPTAIIGPKDQKFGATPDDLKGKVVGVQVRSEERRVGKECRL